MTFLANLKNEVPVPKVQFQRVKHKDNIIFFTVCNKNKVLNTYGITAVFTLIGF
jgi:hypothetical protein